MKRPRALEYASRQSAPPSKSAGDDSAAWVVTTFAMGLLSCGGAAVLWISDVELPLPTLVIISSVPAAAIIMGKQGHWLGVKRVFAIIGIALNSLALAAWILLILGTFLRMILHT